VREAVAEQLASVVKDPLREPLIDGDATRLHSDPTAVVNNALFNLSSGDITVGRHAFFGHNVAILKPTPPATVNAIAGSSSLDRRPRMGGPWPGCQPR